MAPVADISRSPVSADAFERFAGRWIALRDGEVIADAATLDELAANEEVQASDTRFFVPEPDSSFF